MECIYTLEEHDWTPKHHAQPKEMNPLGFDNAAAKSNDAAGALQSKEFEKQERLVKT